MGKDIGKNSSCLTTASAKNHNFPYIRTRVERFEYPQEVRFKCVQCGICCGDTQHRTRHILLLTEEAKRIAEIAKRAANDIATKIESKEPYVFELNKDSIDGKCIFLLENHCTIYFERPLICRFFPFGLETGEDKRPVFFFTNECPGIGKGMEMKENDFRELLNQAKKRTGNK